MAENRKRSTDRPQRQQSRQRRQLRFEPLESRSLLSAIAVAAPEAGGNLAPVESLPQPTVAVSPAGLGGIANGLAQAEMTRLQATSRSLVDQIMGLNAASLDGRQPLGSLFANSVAFSTGNAHNSIGESMVISSQSLPRLSLMSLSGRGAWYDSTPFGGSLVDLAPPGESSGSAGSINGMSMAMPESRLSVEVVSANPEPVSAWRGSPTAGRSMIAATQLMPGRSLGLSAGTDVLHALTPLPNGRFDAFAVDSGGPIGSMPEQYAILPVASSASGSSVVALPVSGSDPWFGSTVHSAGSLPASSYDVAEGGYVEIGDTPLTSGRFTPARETNAWSLDGGNLGDPATHDSQIDDVSREVGILARNEGRPAQRHSDDRSDDTVQIELADENTSQPSNAAEGGMVELSAAAPQDVQPSSTNSEDAEPLPNAKEIELDNGLGLFHAFELATAPTQHGDEVGEAAEKTGGAGAGPEADTSATPDVSAMKKSASAESDADGQAVLRGAAFSSVLLAAMLVPISSIRREKRASERRQTT
jgi:hypothetical protein